ncbi:MAG: DNA mismatch repair protein MutS, partial [Bacilli bacterium]|nr:DNA mismatch repair protein MutS [Bacilli bacterium]
VTAELNLDEKEYNFITTVDRTKDNYIFAYSDLTTGENFLTTLPINDDILQAEILKLKSKEIVISSDFNKNILKPLKELVSLTISIEDNTSDVDYLMALSSDLTKEERKAFNRLLNYIIGTQKKVLVHMQKVSKYNINGYMRIDYASRRNLELLETIRFQNKKNTLISVLDKCVTAMGSRFLRKNIIFPLVDKDKITERYEIVKKINNDFITSDELKNELSNVYDLERIVGKISYESCNPRDLLQLKKSLGSLPGIIKATRTLKINKYFKLEEDFDSFKTLHNLIDKAISMDAPLSSRDRGIINKGYNAELDELNEINNNGKEYLLKIEANERERTGIKLLKVGYNRVFGYYLEVPNGSLSLIKDEYGFIRKQTLSTGERFITQELKEKESTILRAEEKAYELEYKLFVEIRNECKKYSDILQKLAREISYLDMMQSFSRVSKENGYVMPKISDDGMMDLVEARHPVVELSMKSGDNKFVPNDIKMDNDHSILLITGPNMSGKSTYMREAALIIIMAQIGSFVPAKSATLPIFDAIFTRIGAADDIVSGESTFMVEMSEVNNALQNATKDSLILFDEIGRGTSTYDGMALAQAIIEYVHENIKCKTLFSTHYHELTSLEDDLDHLTNVHVTAEEVNGEIVFMHKVLKGSASKSYGINVAKLASIPLDVILRAEDLLRKLETNTSSDHDNLSIKNYQAPLLYDSKTEIEKIVLDKIKEANLFNMSPMEAINFLDELQKTLKK